MKTRLFILSCIALIMLCGCTGCDQDQQVTDLSGNRDILTMYTWVAQEDSYSCAGEPFCAFTVEATSPEDQINYMVAIYPDEMCSCQNNMAIVTYTGDDPVFTTVENIDFVLRITATVEQEITLSLKDGNGVEYYFSPSST